MSKIYIAYGSNLNMQQMADRCPTAKFLGTGVIENYELQFKGRLYNAHATITSKPGARVQVGLWAIEPMDEKRLDVYEGYPNYYFKQNVDVQVEGKTLRGMAYIMDQRMDFGYPAQRYYNTIYQGYKDCDFPVAELNKAVEQSITQAEQRVQSQQFRMDMG